MICKLAMEDGTVFTGRGLGATGTRAGEVVFNTSMMGYQEILTDPSYCGQIVTMTFPMIGNYGVNAEDFESARPFLSGFVVREACEHPSNYRSTATLAEALQRFGVIGISGVDTRAITRRTRIHGALRGVISTEVLDDAELVRMARAASPMSGANLVDAVAVREVREWTEPLWHPQGGSVARVASSAARPPAHSHVVAIDCGIKSNILRWLREAGVKVTVVPADASAGRIRELKPTALLIGNGPGDPAAVTQTIQTLRELLGKVPALGICLGHQMVGLALGAETYKLRFGHHGGNQPVLNRPAGRVEITAQNHGFAVEEASLKRVGGQVTHVNLNDGSVEGFVHPDRQVLCVQFHPEAGPGPNDAAYLFRRFVERVSDGRPIDADMLAAV
ncbi:MAG: glutamine-hydrolyzing carbamoyl-phosphate synthase small subunit [Phycisphaerales bacterium]|nr:glutamine-hydrolyzing carbamoyl-phosphate synthase small subunit [Phycisphaerales bacterium]